MKLYIRFSIEDMKNFLFGEDVSDTIWNDIYHNLEIDKCCDRVNRKYICSDSMEPLDMIVSFDLKSDKCITKMSEEDEVKIILTEIAKSDIADVTLREVLLEAPLVRNYLSMFDIYFEIRNEIEEERKL